MIPSALTSRAKTKEFTHLFTLTRYTVELEVSHQEPAHWEDPFGTLVVLISAVLLVCNLEFGEVSLSSQSAGC